MHPIALVALISPLCLAGCAGYDGPWTAEIETTAEMNDSVPGVTNDGFYDGGVFDQDLLGLEPMR